MNGILPLHIQRSLEQRWAAKFASPVASAAPKHSAVNETLCRDQEAVLKQSSLTLQLTFKIMGERNA